MAGIVWGDVESFGVHYDMSHLRPAVHQVVTKSGMLSIEITFGFHVFTDEKGDGKLISHRMEQRYFCPSRYEGSKTLTARILGAVDADYVTAFISGTSGQRYYHLNSHDDFILMEIRKPSGTNDFLRLHVVSAYTMDKWGKIPRGKNLPFEFVLSQRVAGINKL
ncbi:hypothetical protein [Aeromonas dhakensis]|uniref:hypothetical protein n=2 Tax=Aeromonas dhakensis TaxID=196024 RepID=UPI003F797CF5